MLLLDDPLLLYRYRKTYSFEEYLKKHLCQVHSLQYLGGEHISTSCRYLNHELVKYAKAKSPIYNIHKGVIDKQHLLDAQTWYVTGHSAHTATTGGSTTGSRFNYLRWATHYNQIEGDTHYKAILQEFKLDRPINVLYLMLDQSDDPTSEILTKVYRTNNILISHGQGQQATIHEVIKNKHYYQDYYVFYEKIFEYCIVNNIDVILAPGQVIASLAWNARRTKQTQKVCHLLSNTGDKVDRTDLDSLKECGIIGNWCDHMRCWDGGITFMTCEHHTYHLIDGLAWTYSDSENRLISYDYYSLPSPFVNYWNGDYGTVGKEFKRCQCGRYYRNFEISRTRSVVMSGVTNRAVRDTIISTDIDVEGILRAEGTGTFLRLFTIRPYSTTERQKIRRALPHLNINFVTEEPNG